MIAILTSVLMGSGVFLIYQEASGLQVVSSRGKHRRSTRERAQSWFLQAGMGEVSPQEFVGVSAGIAILGGACGFVTFGGALPAVGIGLACGLAPLALYRNRRAQRRSIAHDAWPQLIEEIRVLTSSAGRSIPQALFEVGLRGPEELRPAFVVAQREWLMSTDFENVIGLLRHHLDDPSADATCETLLVAHQIGGTGLDRRLSELAEDRRVENLGRKDARSKQAGVQFARRFVILVPAGMALAGMSLGDGREAYQTPTGQVLVAIGVGLVVLCWVWSGRMLRLPSERRIFQ